MIYVLAYPEFEPSISEKIDHFRSLNDLEKSKLVCPHITLVFGLKQADPKSILGLCEDVSRKTTEFTVEFTSSEVAYDPFEKTHKLCLIWGDGKAALSALHTQLYKGPHRAELTSEFPYRPHMTIAAHSKRNTVEALTVSDVGELPIIGMIKALHVVKLVDGRLRTLKTTPLQSELQPQGQPRMSDS